MDQITNPSYLLGTFLATVQSMEEAVPNKVPKGDDWGEQIFPLFSANLESTMQMAKTIVASLPPSVTIKEGQTITLDDLQNIVNRIDFAALQNGNIHKEDFIRGYHMDKTEDYVAKPSNHSFNLGVFMASLYCMEQGSLSHQDVNPNQGEDIFLMLNLNFENTMQMAEKVISTLPQTATFHGKEITIGDMKSAYELI